MDKQQAREYLNDFWRLTLGWSVPPDIESQISNLFTLECLQRVLGYLDEKPESSGLIEGMRQAKILLGGGTPLNITWHVLLKAGCVYTAGDSQDSVVTSLGRAFYFAVRAADVHSWRKELHEQMLREYT